MATCPSCGEDNPDRARFCWSCGAALAEVAPSGAEERKVVSILFVDLVGFTARSDRADPEDVRATLRPYHARLKQELQSLQTQRDRLGQQAKDLHAEVERIARQLLEEPDAPPVLLLEQAA